MPVEEMKMHSRQHQIGVKTVKPKEQMVTVRTRKGMMRTRVRTRKETRMRMSVK
jgi:hypothetical protein